MYTWTDFTMVKMVRIYGFLIFFWDFFTIEGSSHRARIPSTLNWQFKMNVSSSLYTLNVSSGKDVVLNHFNLIVFVGVFIETLENDEVRIERRLFASQEYTELLLAHVVLTRKTDNTASKSTWISYLSLLFIDQQSASLRLRVLSLN